MRSDEILLVRDAHIETHYAEASGEPIEIICGCRIGHDHFYEEWELLPENYRASRRRLNLEQAS